MTEPRDRFEYLAGRVVPMGFASGVSCGLAFYSEFIQGHVAHYWKIYRTLGEGVANFAIGQMGDVLGPVGAALMTTTIFTAMSSIIDMPTEFRIKINKKLAYVAAYSGMAFGLIGIAQEISNFNLTSERLKMCVNPNYLCRGDVLDLLSFSAPIIAGGIFLSRMGGNKVVNKD